MGLVVLCLLWVWFFSGFFLLGSFSLVYLLMVLGGYDLLAVYYVIIFPNANVLRLLL